LNAFDSGYQRIMVSPGIEVDMHPVSFYADVEVPVFLDFRGNQLVARWLLKILFELSLLGGNSCTSDACPESRPKGRL
jgi:hypothetical protein